MKKISLFLLTLPLCAIGSLTFVDTATAQQVTQQVTPDGTVSTTVTTPDGKNFTINDGTRRGGNLFHSFKEFSVPAGGSANFNNAADVLNIIGRVTGGSVSNIDGAITALGKANLFLLNPNGIIFGPNASLRIGGSFLGSTANSLLFDNGFEFSATNPQAPPLLSINVPIGLGFRNNPGAIQVQGPGNELVYNAKAGPRDKFDSNVTGLQVEPGKTLALVGGNVSVNRGVLRSKGGRIEIGSFDSNQVVRILPQEQGLSLGYEGTPSLRDIEFSNKSFVNVTGDGGGSIAIVGKNINLNSESFLLSDTLGDKNGGEIRIVGDSIIFNRASALSNTFSSGNGAQIKLDANNITFQNQSGVSIQTWGSGKAGDINIGANSLEIGGGSAFVSITIGNSTGLAGDINMSVKGPLVVNTAGITADSSGTGNAGKININANSLQIENSGINSRAFNSGFGGEINFNIADSLTIKGTNITTNTYGRGDAGKINITAGSFRLQEGVGVSSQAQENSRGKGGEINITVAGTLESGRGVGIQTSTYGQGDAGKINIRANSLRAKNSAISSNTTASGTGNGGEIKITVADLFDLNATGVKTQNLGNGNGGDIQIQTNNFSLSNGSQVSASTSGKGNGGSVTVNATGNISADGQFTNGNKSGFYSTVGSSGVGNAGGVNITARSLSLTNGGTVSTSNAGSGAAGNITVTTAKDIRLDNQASIDANTKGGQGDISLNSGDFILRNNSNITTNAQGTAGGGNIRINTENLVALDDTSITANAEKGFGGRIFITAQGIFRSPDSKITAISEAGQQFNGIVQFNTPEIDPSQGLFELTETVTDAAQQVAQNPCIKGFGSTFTITGRGGLPSDPNKILSSDNVRVDLIEPVVSTVSLTTATEKKPSQQPTVKKIIPAQGWIYNDKGQVVLVGYDPTKTGPQREQPAPTSNCAATR
ncbi:hypothetical protein DP113_11790 [Brasilonema octagenarum UFV-E1]|nr:hypothetical protein DP113_11790 [Brasilonema octagenarum UFV-E1]